MNRDDEIMRDVLADTEDSSRWNIRDAISKLEDVKNITRWTDCEVLKISDILKEVTEKIILTRSSIDLYLAVKNVIRYRKGD